MTKNIKIKNKNAFKINTSMRWLRIYRDTFGHDILPDLIPIIDTGINAFAEIVAGENVDIDKVEEELYSLEFVTINNIIWALVKNADDSTPDVEEWEDEFGTFPLDEIIPQIVTAIAETYVSEKKLKLLKAGLEQRQFQLMRSLSQGSIED